MLKKSSLRIGRRATVSTNVKVARILHEFVKTALGPRGMDKLLIDAMGQIKVTNDGATILGIDVQHPVAKMLVEAAKAVDMDVGDGTKTTVLLACELLMRSEDLLEEMHPTQIIKGYSRAADRAIRTVEQISIPIDLHDFEALRKVALTSLESKLSGRVKEHFAELAVKAVRRIVETRERKTFADIERILIVKRRGRSLLDTDIIDGIVEIQPIAHPDMPRIVANAKIALLNYMLIVAHPKIPAEVEIDEPQQVEAFLNKETAILESMVRKVASTGANVLICQWDIDDKALECLARQPLMTLRKVSKKDMEKIARATGGKIVGSLDDLDGRDLGYAKLVEERKLRYRLEEDKLVFIEGCRDPKSLTILIRGGLDRALDQAETAIHDALFVVSDIFRKNRVVPGGGAVEIEIAKRLRQYSTEFRGKEQLAVRAYADAIEIVPRTLIENAGLDVLEHLTELRAKHSGSSGAWTGVDSLRRRLSSMKGLGVLEPSLLKEHVIRTATEIAAAILRVDDMIASRKVKASSSQPDGSQNLID